jgi:hypothetical protein
MGDSPLATILNTMTILVIFAGIWKLVEMFILIPFINRSIATKAASREYTDGSLPPLQTRRPSKDTPSTPDSTPAKEPRIYPHHLWMKIVQEKPDESPHTLIIGSTGSGKTWLAQALATARTGGVAILDPKWKPGKWGGAPVTTVDDDLSYTSLEEACQSLLGELKKRQVALKYGQETFQPLTVVVEELPTMLDECPTAPLLFKRLGQLGRELRIRVIGLSQSDRVKTLKLEGEGDARSNYLFIRLGEHALKVCPAAAALARPACIEWHKNNYPIDVSRVPELVQQPIPPARWWVIEPRQTDPASTPQQQNPHWSEEHIRVASWLAQTPGISIREIARRLYPGSDGSGSYSVQAKTLIEDVQQVVGMTRDSWGNGHKTSNSNSTPTQNGDGIPHSDEVYQDTDEVHPERETITDDDIRRLHFHDGWSKTKITSLLKGSKQERLARVTTALKVNVSVANEV